MSASESPAHDYVPKHSVLSDDEADKVLKQFNIGPESLPKIKSSDPALAGLEFEIGDVIKVERKDSTAKNIFYRRVVK